jgi:two-component system, OmpR family, alkaline phosphatase synthesis response regulator PhoP
MHKPYVLVVDDEEDIAELVSYNLNREGFEVVSVYSGEDALKSVAKRIPDVMVLDLMLPGVSGIGVSLKLKGNEETKNIPIILLSARGEESDIVSGLEAGADDYVTKPFSPKVLNARIRAALRRGAQHEQVIKSDTLTVESITIDSGRCEVTVGDALVDLTKTEFNILKYLARNKGWVFTRQQLVVAVHGSDYPVTDRSIDVQITGLRKKLGDDGGIIETVRGVGYRFRDQASTEQNLSH